MLFCIADRPVKAFEEYIWITAKQFFPAALPQTTESEVLSPLQIKAWSC